MLPYRKNLQQEGIRYFLSEPKGYIGVPCLPQSQCRDSNAQCSNNLCACRNEFYNDRGICRTSATFIPHPQTLSFNIMSVSSCRTKSWAWWRVWHHRSVQWRQHGVCRWTLQLPSQLRHRLRHRPLRLAPYPPIKQISFKIFIGFFIFCAVLLGGLNNPCLESGGCLDRNAECNGVKCICKTTHFERSNICGTTAHINFRFPSWRHMLHLKHLISHCSAEDSAQLSMRR